MIFHIHSLFPNGDNPVQGKELLEHPKAPYTWFALQVKCWREVFAGRRMPNDNFRMNTGSGRYGAAYYMVALLCFNEELLLLPKNPTEAKLQSTSTRGESTEPT
jgi:hypothetical protein